MLSFRLTIAAFFVQQLEVSSSSRAKHSDGICDDDKEHHDEEKNEAGTARRQWFEDVLNHPDLLSIEYNMLKPSYHREACNGGFRVLTLLNEYQGIASENPGHSLSTSWCLRISPSRGVL